MLVLLNTSDIRNVKTFWPWCCGIVFGHSWTKQPQNVFVILYAVTDIERDYIIEEISWTKQCKCNFFKNEDINQKSLIVPSFLSYVWEYNYKTMRILAQFSLNFSFCINHLFLFIVLKINHSAARSFSE